MTGKKIDLQLKTCHGCKNEVDIFQARGTRGFVVFCSNKCLAAYIRRLHWMEGSVNGS